MNPASKVLDIAVALSAGSERELLDRFRQGDTDAFSAPYRDYSPAVFRFALYMTGDHGKAAEMTRGVFVWLIRHPDKSIPSVATLQRFLPGWHASPSTYAASGLCWL
jgi:hypothetical protein